MNSGDQIFARVIPHGNPHGGAWKHMDGALTAIAADTWTGVWGVNKASNIFYRNGITHDCPEGKGWTQVDGAATQISCGGGEVWVVNAKGEIYRRKGVHLNHAGGGWEKIDGGLTQVNIDGGRVIGCNLKDEIFERDPNAGTNRRPAFLFCVAPANDVIR